MLDPEGTNDQTTPTEGAPPSDSSSESGDTSPAPVKKAAAKRTAKAPAKKAAAKRTTKKVAKSVEAPLDGTTPAAAAVESSPEAGADGAAETPPASATTGRPITATRTSSIESPCRRPWPWGRSPWRPSPWA